MTDSLNTKAEWLAKHGTIVVVNGANFFQTPWKAEFTGKLTVDGAILEVTKMAGGQSIGDAVEAVYAAVEKIVTTLGAENLHDVEDD